MPRLVDRHVLVWTTAWLVASALACAVGDETGGPALTFDPSAGNGGTAGSNGDGATSVDDGNDDDDGDGDGTAGDDDGVDDGVDGAPCQDADGDGFGINCAPGDDCDDTNPMINPGAAEACNGGDDNCDGQVDNGCECPDDGVSGNCMAPQDLGTLNLGDNVVSVVGNVPQEGALDWYAVSFPAAGRPGEGSPRIAFSLNENDAFVFDVVRMQCDAAGMPCGTGGTNGNAVALTEWSFVDDDPGCCDASQQVPDWPNQVFVRVYRTTMGASCSAYQLTISR